MNRSFKFLTALAYLAAGVGALFVALAFIVGVFFFADGHQIDRFATWVIAISSLLVLTIVAALVWNHFSPVKSSR